MDKVDCLRPSHLLRNRLDGYKLSLGLPPDLSVQVKDQYIEKFRLTDPVLVSIQDQLNQLLQKIRNPEVSLKLSDLQDYGKQTQDMRKSLESEFFGINVRS
jgi:hypothetical protein